MRGMNVTLILQSLRFASERRIGEKKMVLSSSSTVYLGR